MGGKLDPKLPKVDSNLNAKADLNAPSLNTNVKAESKQDANIGGNIGGKIGGGVDINPSIGVEGGGKKSAKLGGFSVGVKF